MKSLLTLISAVILIGAYSFMPNDGNNENHVIAIAKAALKQNCDNTQGNLGAIVTNMGRCYTGDGVVKKVVFIRNGEQIGTVLVNCETKAYKVACGNEEI